ncbi:unnamed protein product [Trichobilharzia regenti]|nr:unnamed protein product [Trichobilharzia regenti]
MKALRLKDNRKYRLDNLLCMNNSGPTKCNSINNNNNNNSNNDVISFADFYSLIYNPTPHGYSNLPDNDIGVSVNVNADDDDLCMYSDLEDRNIIII